jgi:hypothetical protein
MIHAALTLVAAVVLIYFACLALVAVGWVVLGIASAVAAIVTWPFEIVGEFGRNWRRR